MGGDPTRDRRAAEERAAKIQCRMENGTAEQINLEIAPPPMVPPPQMAPVVQAPPMQKMNQPLGTQQQGGINPMIFVGAGILLLLPLCLCAFMFLGKKKRQPRRQPFTR